MEKWQNASFPLLSSLIAFFMTIIYLLLRYPFETEYTSVMKVFGTSLFLINTPFATYVFFERARTVSFYALNVRVTISLLFVLIAAGFLNVTGIGYPILALGATGFCVTSYHYFQNFNLKKLLSPILILILVLWLAGSVWEGRILTPLTFEKIMGGFYNNPKDMNYGLDNLYHMSIAQMIKTYNIPSTGLDELPYIPYHFGSHFVFAQLSKAINISIPDIYNLGFPVIFLPLFFHLAFIIFHQFRDLTGSTAKFDIVFWVLLFVIFIGFLPNDPSGYAVRTGLAWNSLIKSESYLVSLMLFFIYISLFLIPLLKHKVFNISWLHLTLLILVLVLIGICKISTLFMLDLIIGYAFIRYKIFKSLKGNVMLFFTVIISLGLAYLLHDPKGPGGSFEFNHFYRTFIYSRFHFFIAFYFIWTFALIAICAALYIQKIRFNTTLLKMQVLIAIIGFLPGLLIRVEGGSAHYFSDIQHWTAFFFIAYYGSLLIQNIEHKILLRLTYGVCILMIFLGAVNCLYSFKMLAKDNYITKQGVLGKEIRHVNLVSTAEMIDNRALFFTQALKMALVQNENFHKLKAIAALDNLPRKKERILYIEDEQWLTEYLQCYKYPFLLTGTTGISLLNGFSLNDCYWGGYGVEYYRDIRSFPAGQDLCDLVASPMFEEIISYNINKESYTIITCKK